MKSTYLSIGFFLFAFALRAEVTLRGIVTYQNTGKKMDALQVSARGASPTISRSNTNTEGVFVLTFPNGKVGDVVYLELGTPIYDLVNDKRELEIVLTDKPDYKVRLVVCKKGERDANAVEYYNISTKYLETTYQKLIKKKENAIADLQKQLTQTGANTDELTKQLYALKSERAKLDDQLEEQKKNAYKLAEDFSRIDLAQADAIYRTAFETFKAGDIDGARQVLNSKEAKQQELDLNKLNTDIQKSESQVQKIEDSVKVAKQRIAIAKGQRDSLKVSVIQKKMLDGKLAELQDKYDEAERLYTEGVLLDSLNGDNMWLLAHFLSTQRKYEESLYYYDKLQTFVISNNKKTLLFNQLGNVYRSLNNMSKAKTAYQNALLNITNSSAEDTLALIAHEALILNNLGNLYRQDSLEEAKKIFKKALSKYRYLNQRNKNDYKIHLAFTLNNMGRCDYDISKKEEKSWNTMSRLMDAGDAFKEALTIYENLAIENPNALNLDEIINFYDLNVMFNDNDKESDILDKYSENLLNRALVVHRKLALTKPNIFNPFVALTLLNLANITGKSKRNKPLALKQYNEALKIHTELVTKNPQVYLLNLIINYEKLGAFYQKTNQSQQALMNIGHSEILRGAYDKAKINYEQLKGKLNTEGKSYKELLLNDFKLFETTGIFSNNIAKIKTEIEKW